MQIEGNQPASAEEIRAFRHRASRAVVLRVMRQRVIAEMLERAAERAERDGKTRQASEMREQAAQARQVADEAIRTTARLAV